MQMGPWQILLIAIVVLVLFGRGKIASMMGEFGKGITAFKKGINDSKAEIDTAAAPAVKDETTDKDKV
jgi:sec-independent protein translocase protein TatA